MSSFFIKSGQHKSILIYIIYSNKDFTQSGAIKFGTILHQNGVFNSKEHILQRFTSFDRTSSLTEPLEPPCWSCGHLKQQVSEYHDFYTTCIHTSNQTKELTINKHVYSAFSFPFIFGCLSNARDSFC